MIKELIPKIGKRSKFCHAMKEYKKSMSTSEARSQVS